MFDLFALNVFAILAATVLGMLIGTAWYSPILFGNAWLAALGKTEEQLSEPAPAMIGAGVSSLVSALALALLIGACGASTLAAGALVGGVCGIGLVAMAMLSDNLFCGWGWPLYWIQAGYRVVYLVAMGAVLGAWPN